MICQVKLINKNKIIYTKLNKNIKTFIIRISSLAVKITIYLVKKVLISLLLVKEITILIEYPDFVNVFSKKLTKMLFKYIRTNRYIMKLKDSKQLIYESIYSLELIKLKTLRIYNKTNLINNFIRPSKSPAVALILFVLKFDSYFYLCINYQRFNNLIILNKYSLFLIEQSKLIKLS